MNTIAHPHLKALAIASLALTALDAQAAAVATRADLETILGANLVLENFETPTVTSQTRYSGSPLSYDTTVPTLGNHLVKPGLVFQRNPDYAITEAGYRGIDWNPAGYFGSTSQVLSGAGGSGGASIRNDFQILFTTPVTAFGVDLLAYSGFPAAGVISVYDNTGTLLGDTNVNGAVGGAFFGWENAEGISKIFIHDNPNGNYIQFDNLAFGTAAPVPIPAALWLFGSAVAGLWSFGRRK
ncbi:MAG: hypothetical protein ACKN9T_15865 [Candidatus Methylumidiphilus sp.]